MKLRWLPILILLGAALLQLWALATYARFHPDEAFYMTFARNAAVNGDWALAGSLDKPPLSLYANALALTFWGVKTDVAGVLQLNVYQGEFAARMLGVFYGVSLVAVSMAWAYALTHQRFIAWGTGFLVALSPYTITFAPTAFTDMPMLLFGVSAALAMARRRPFWSGVCFALALAAKPQAVFWLPLLILPLFAVSYQPLTQAISVPRSPLGTQSSALNPQHSILNPLLRFLSPLTLGILLLWAWDTARPETSVFELGAANNTAGFALVPLAEWFRRAGEWVIWGQWLGGNGIFTLLWLGIGFATLGSQRRWSFLLLGWLGGYSVLHIGTTLNMYDRYLLLAVPPFALWGALGGYNLYSLIKQKQNSQSRGGAVSPPVVTFLGGLFSQYRWIVLTAFLVLGGLGSAWNAASGAISIGSDRGEYSGIDELADYLNAKPVATVIYDRWLGWQMGYYLGQWTNKRRVYYPTPQELTQGALRLPEQGIRYFIAPTDETITEWITELTQAGFRVQFEQQIASFQVYAVIPPVSTAE